MNDPMGSRVDAVVVGSGPNGLAAAVHLARHGRSVTVLEGRPTPGGGTRTAELGYPGVVHDLCSAVHPLGAASPFLATLPLSDHGLEWLHHPYPCVHPLDDERAGIVHPGLDDTAAGLGADGEAWRRSVGYIATHWSDLAPSFLGPPLRFPRHPLSFARFGALGLPSAAWTARHLFRTPEGRGLLAGAAAHAFLPLDAPFTTALAFSLLAPAHISGWPIPAGGSQRITDALVSYLRSLGGEVLCDHPVTSLADLPPHKVALFDTSPRALATIAGTALPASTRRRYLAFRHGPGSFKIDYVLNGPMPWAHPACAGAATVHVGGTFAEVARSEEEVAGGGHPEAPFLLVAQPAQIDPDRSPPGLHPLWVYCHVPARSTVDMTGPIERQLDRFAPGWRDLVVHRHRRGPAEMEADNPNLIGGDIAGGALDGRQLLFRPRLSTDPYSTGNPAIWLCSASAPPGGGVHGMCGFHAADRVLRTTVG